jgi:hypothetical protein
MSLREVYIQAKYHKHQKKHEYGYQAPEWLEG